MDVVQYVNLTAIYNINLQNIILSIFYVKCTDILFLCIICIMLKIKFKKRGWMLRWLAFNFPLCRYLKLGQPFQTWTVIFNAFFKRKPEVWIRLIFKVPLINYFWKIKGEKRSLTLDWKAFQTRKKQQHPKMEHSKERNKIWKWQRRNRSRLKNCICLINLFGPSDMLDSGH